MEQNVALNETNNFDFGYVLINDDDAIDMNNKSIENATSLNYDELLNDLGPRRDSLTVVIPMTIIYCLIFITGIIGNIVTCIVIKKNRSMHTATNYYLFSLAISDFLLLISGVPQEMFFIWYKYPYIFGEYFCVGRGMLAETSANATVLTITAFTVERYAAICHPFWGGQALSKLSRAIRTIVIIWICSILTAIPQAAGFGIHNATGVDKCTVVREVIPHSFQLSTFLFFIAPMSIILILYVLIGVRLHRSNVIDRYCGGGGGGTGGSVGMGSTVIGGSIASNTRSTFNSNCRLYNCQCRKTSDHHRNSNDQENGKSGTFCRHSIHSASHGPYGTGRVLKMLVAVVICFFVCWAPFHAQRLIAIYGAGLMGDDSSNTDTNTDLNTDVNDGHQVVVNNHEIIFTTMTYISGVLYYLSTCINPFVYNIMSNKFRQAFKDILFRRQLLRSQRSNRARNEFHPLRQYPLFKLSSSSGKRNISETETLQTSLPSVQKYT